MPDDSRLRQGAHDGTDRDMTDYREMVNRLEQELKVSGGGEGEEGEYFASNDCTVANLSRRCCMRGCLGTNRRWGRSEGE